MIKIPQKIVAVVNKQSKTLIKNTSDVKIIKCPACINFIGFENTQLGTNLLFEGVAKERNSVKILVDNQEYDIKCVVFEQKEFFLSMVISSNFHVGLDPENCIRGCDDPKLHNVSGHGFFKTCRTLEPVYHSHNVPITWLIDNKVAKDGNEKLAYFHEKYADDFGFMPSSNFHHNPQNYNIQKTEQEVFEIVSSEVEQLETQLKSYTNLIGIDQWVGSVGSKFVKAAEKLGMHGIWGLGFDHPTCDSSMFHRGCPWDVYKPNRDNIKIPCTYPSDLWAFQWTTRDIINSLQTPKGGCCGSVIFSTDPDDIRVMGIMENQENYFEKMLRNYKASMADNDFFVFLVHEEDHETHIEQNNIYLDKFLNNVKEDVTLATLTEISEWLNIIYEKEECACQKLYVEDPLECQDKVLFQRKRINKPDGWGNFNPHCAFYDNKRQVIFEKPLRIPLRIYDYEKNHIIKEVDSYPEEVYGKVEFLSEEYNNCTYTLTVNSEREEKGYPIIVWDSPWTSCLDDDSVVVTQHYTLIFVDLKSGNNTIKRTFK